MGGTFQRTKIGMTNLGGVNIWSFSRMIWEKNFVVFFRSEAPKKDFLIVKSA